MVVGDGPHLPALREEADRLGVSSQVEFTGWVTGRELTDRIASCDVCACPDPVNPFTERSTMLKVMEYMALGRPIVQFDTPEARFSAGQAAFYATPGDEADFAGLVARLLDSATLRTEMGTAGRHRVESHLSWDHQVPRLLEAYSYVARLHRDRTRALPAGVRSRPQSSR